MKLMTEPDEGITPLLAAVKRAKRRLAIVIFRFDLDELEDAIAAVARSALRSVARRRSPARRSGPERGFLRRSPLRRSSSPRAPR